jgi:hypothetical protein
MNGMLDGCDGASVDIMSNHQRQAAHRPVPVDVPRSSCRGESFFISKNASVFLKKSMTCTVIEGFVILYSASLRYNCTPLRYVTVPLTPSPLPSRHPSPPSDHSASRRSRSASTKT